MIRRRPIPRTPYRWTPKVKPEHSQHYETILDGAAIRYRDGREVCQPNAAGRRLYASRVGEMVQRQEFLCSLCNERLSVAGATFEHERRRGAHGCRRDDRIVDDHGNWLNSAAHFVCNSKRG